MGFVFVFSEKKSLITLCKISRKVTILYPTDSVAHKWTWFAPGFRYTAQIWNTSWMQITNEIEITILIKIVLQFSSKFTFNTKK